MDCTKFLPFKVEFMMTLRRGGSGGLILIRSSSLVLPLILHHSPLLVSREISDEALQFLYCPTNTYIFVARLCGLLILL